MNKKTLAIVLVIFLLLAGIGAYLKFGKSPAVQPTEKTTATTQTNPFNSIKDALSKSLSLQCEFTDTAGKKTTAYIKAGNVRADVVGNDPTQQYNNASVIIKDKKMYFWDQTKKQGMMLTQPDVAVTGTQGSTAAQSGASTQQQNVMASLEQFKDHCKTAVVSDSLFTPPTDVTFQDISKMMIAPSGVPTSGSGTNAVPSVNYQQYMQQYAPKGQ